MHQWVHDCIIIFFFNDTATTEIYTLHIVGSVRCVQETVSTQSTWVFNFISNLYFKRKSFIVYKCYKVVGKCAIQSVFFCFFHFYTTLGLFFVKINTGIHSRAFTESYPYTHFTTTYKWLFARYYAYKPSIFINYLFSLNHFIQFIFELITGKYLQLFAVRLVTQQSCLKPFNQSQSLIFNIFPRQNMNKCYFLYTYVWKTFLKILLFHFIQSLSISTSSISISSISLYSNGSLRSSLLHSIFQTLLLTSSPSLFLSHVLCVDTPVSYTHLTLPTICSVQISVVAVSLKKKIIMQS
eukprot:TRINITY_DN16427_c0_g1_i1.p1 TRINITY_DN16427_c0_g1~~TRINITY_DN16427_c0_g1_i1.p1  ORF type:complete len:296 (+),score=20.87 TRINITY_DN16427_c0_g1_i1:102-989(+)